MAKKIVVLGAGITGVAVAYELSKKGYSVILLEKNDKIGGFIVVLNATPE